MKALIRNIMVLCFALQFAVSVAYAADQRITPEMVTAALEAQGYEVQSVTVTLLRRARIIASSGGIWREVVLDVSSGQILRDYAVEFAPNDQPPPGITSMPRGGTIVSEAAPELSN